jgi:predicted O-linked N-acetylglucosamine transferase (SPINDLY family)
MLKSLFNRILPLPRTPAPSPDDIAIADKLIDEGNGQEDGGQLSRAEDSYLRAATIAPGHARAHLNLGILRADKGDIAGATRAYDTVLAIDRHHPFGNYNFARLAYLGGNLEQAKALVRVALQAKPEFPQAAALLSSVLHAQGDSAAAAEAMATALRLDPGNFGFWLTQAAQLYALRRHDEAESAVRQALALDPQSPEALKLLSDLFCVHGFAAQALELLLKAIQIDPARLDFRSSALMLMNYDEELDANALFEQHREFGIRLEQAFPVRFARYTSARESSRRLRVGYVSGDLWTHPVTLFLMPVFERHDREQFEIFCYSSTHNADHITERVRGLSNHWVDAAAMSDAQLADRIHSDAIDILVDLTGHTGRSRLPVFAQRPAPVQATWLGYLNTTGLTRMDYRLCDRRTDPSACSQARHTEELVHLPHSQWCYRPFLSTEVPMAAPVETNNHVTFGSFNSAMKISAAMCRRWGQLLLRVPHSRLRIADIASEQKRESIRRELLSLGIAEERFEFLPRVDLAAYYKLFSTIDICLDTFPYGGGTTTFDALWMGVPVVTATGSIPVSRSAASILSALGLDAWIAPSVDEFVDVAARHAADRQTIAKLRQTLRQQLQQSPLTDEATYVRDLEAAYRQMWNAGLAPAGKPSQSLGQQL